MEYKVGDKVKYDSGEWVFYGTVTAIIENSLCPCYRLIVDRMEKKYCKFPITQFEFELAADNDSAIGEDNHKWVASEKEYLEKQRKIQRENSIEIPMIQSVPEEPVQIVEPSPEVKPKKKRLGKPGRKAKKTDEAVQAPLQEEAAEPKKRNTWSSHLESYLRGEKSAALSNWMAQNRRMYKTGKLAEEKFNKLVEINFPFEAGKKGRKKKEST